MASPQRRDPNEVRPVPPPALENLPAVERQVGTGGVFSWWWLWIPVVIAAFWFIGWGWGPYGGWWWGHGAESNVGSSRATAPAAPNTNSNPANGALAGGVGTTGNEAATGTANSGAQGNRNGIAAAPAAPAAQITGPGVAVLDATNKRTYIGQSFQVNNIPIEKRSSNRAVWIGAGNTGNAGPILLVLPQGTSLNLQEGGRLDVTGKVMKAPPSSRARHEWGLSGDDVQQLEKVGAYVEGTQVRQGQS